MTPRPEALEQAVFDSYEAVPRPVVRAFSGDRLIAGKDLTTVAEALDYGEARARAALAALLPPVASGDVQYSFDDLHFGLSANGNRSLTTRLVARPEGLTNESWYAFGGAMLAALTSPTPSSSQ